MTASYYLALSPAAVGPLVYHSAAVLDRDVRIALGEYCLFELGDGLDYVPILAAHLREAANAGDIELIAQVLLLDLTQIAMALILLVYFWRRFRVADIDAMRDRLFEGIERRGARIVCGLVFFAGFVPILALWVYVILFYVSIYPGEGQMWFIAIVSPFSIGIVMHGIVAGGGALFVAAIVPICRAVIRAMQRA